MIRVILVDDHAVVLDGLERVLGNDPRVRVVGTSRTVAEGHRLCRLLQPDVLVLDVRLPDSRGIEEVKAFRADHPMMKIIVLTGYGTSLRGEAMSAGADAFLTKDLASETIVETVTHLGNNGMPVEERRICNLTEREMQVARLAAQGKNNPQIADELSISRNTVKTHLANAMAKLGFSSRFELALDWKDRKEASDAAEASNRASLE